MVRAGEVSAGLSPDPDPRVLRYAGVLGINPVGLTLASGQTSDVVVDLTRDVVWRFPRYPSGVASLGLTATRTAVAAQIGLAAPEVLGVSPDGPPGQAYVCFRRLAGVGVSPGLLASLGPQARSRFCSDLADLLLRLREADATAWPAPEVGWVKRWQLLAQHVGTAVLPRLPAPGRALAQHDLAAAVAAAVDAPAGLLHGDLGSTNLLIDPIDGRLTGVLDWEGAGPGDPAVDLAALRATFDRDHTRPRLMDLLLDVAPVLTSDLFRANLYLGTFALQEALHGALNEDAEAWAAGTAAYR